MSKAAMPAVHDCEHAFCVLKIKRRLLVDHHDGARLFVHTYMQINSCIHGHVPLWSKMRVCICAYMPANRHTEANAQFCVHNRTTRTCKTVACDAVATIPFAARVVKTSDLDWCLLPPAPATGPPLSLLQ